jgi:hypothetical protein
MFHIVEDTSIKFALRLFDPLGLSQGLLTRRCLEEQQHGAYRIYIDAGIES